MNGSQCVLPCGAVCIAGSLQSLSYFLEGIMHCNSYQGHSSVACVVRFDWP